MAAGRAIRCAAPGSQPTGRYQGQHRERYGHHGGDAELVREDLPAKPAARDTGRDTDHQGDPG
jgi:hypothetical protein